MKANLLIFITALTSITAYAQPSNIANVANSQSISGAASHAEAYSNGYISNSGNNVAASDMGNAVGMATAPALTTTLTETCMGSVSAGAGFAGGSISFGTTVTDTDCVNRLNSREIRAMGDIQVAKEIMCENEVVRESFKRVGRPCVVDGGSYPPTQVSSNNTVQPSLEEAAAVKRKQDELDD